MKDFPLKINTSHLLFIFYHQNLSTESEAKGNTYLKFQIALYKKIKLFSSLAANITSMLFSSHYGAVSSFVLFCLSYLFFFYLFLMSPRYRFKATSTAT